MCEGPNGFTHKMLLVCRNGQRQDGSDRISAAVLGTRSSDRALRRAQAFERVLGEEAARGLFDDACTFKRSRMVAK